MSTGSFHELAAEFWKWRLEEFPEFATFCGCHDYDNRLNDHSHEAFERRIEECKGFVAQCEKLQTSSSLSGEDKISLELLLADLNTFISGAKHQGYLFPISYLEGMHTDFEQLTSWMDFSSIESYEKYLSRLDGIPERLAQDEANMRLGMKTGRTMHKLSLSTVVEQIASLVNTPTEDGIFYAPLKTHQLDLEKMKPLQQEACQIIDSAVKPAFQKLSDFIQNDYMPCCRKQEGVSSLPGGDDFYAACLRFHLSIDMTPQEVHELGLKEVERIKNQMLEVIKKTGFQGDFHAFVEHLRTNDKFYYKDTDSALAGYKHLCQNVIRPTLKKAFHKIPESELIIQSVPETRPNAPMGYYLAGTLDGSRPGKYYVNLNQLHNAPHYEMMTLSLHEGEPGHHFQGMYAIEQSEMPDFRRYLEDMYYCLPPSRFPLHTAYCEGWGLYCEWLGNELGLYDDPYSLFGQLSFEMHRACRLVADTGIHAFGWSYDQALKLILENTAIPLKYAQNEVKRYISWPGQACAYKVGQLKIRELRKKAENALGSAFDVRDFHEVVLACGQVTLAMLEKLVDSYIKEKSPQK